jgi:8-oxo-dGTP pyrophosphatase MutT (NUDIX family)
MMLKRAVRAAIFNNKHELLTVQRAHKPIGLWELVGGTIHPGELPEDTLVREVKEEAGLVVDSVDLFLCDDQYPSHCGEHHYIRNTYLVTVKDTSNVTISSEHTAYGWVRWKQLQDVEPMQEMDRAAMVLAYAVYAKRAVDQLMKEIQK